MTSLGCRTVLYMAKTGVGHRCLPQQCSNHSKRPRQGRSSSQVPKSLSLLLHAASEPVWARHSGVDLQSQNMGAEADCSKFQSSLWVPGQPGLKQEALSPKQNHGNNKLLLPALSSWSLKHPWDPWDPVDVHRRPHCSSLKRPVEKRFTQLLVQVHIDGKLWDH